ncbi:choline ABC transporter substrate-binding protein [Marinobacterium lutimaris]|uniref:Glycine betaine/proline transport system substrate-binding protein n=1 Tax=Marinobacterium lutimaris TaxID=568106 RepID=A0A1H5TYT4_9GAMM|nr:choline ABC transporter substrate-binding protein [Marinobacterium lutimaris]SEF68004.1 glycine betaine/proline transport system substrate-binding protein [Marinobacterium lutimaris]
MRQSLFKLNTLSLATTLGLGLLSGGALAAQDPESCRDVSMSGPGWTDIAATNAVTSTLLLGLGYTPKVDTLAVPIGFEGLKSGEVDLFLGNWMPAQKDFFAKYEDSVDVIGTNLEGAKFTLAVPKYVYDAGVTDFADLAKFADEFREKIYGIEPGSASNEMLMNMVESGDFGLEGWSVVESGEQGTLSQVRRAVRREQFIVFLGWEPHPMNNTLEMEYLTGGDDYFGPNFGGATVRTLTRTGYSEECGNVGQLLTNLSFNLEMENEIMGYILDDGMSDNDAARKWLSENPEAIKPWLENVTTLSGEPGLAAVEASLAQK